MPGETRPGRRARSTSRWTRRRVPVVVLVAATTLAAACSGERLPEVNVSGSSTVEPISTRVAELFDDTGVRVAVTVDGPGTGDGFAAFCNGESHVTGASRPVKDVEMERCRAAGVELVELKVARDGIVLLTHRENDVECLSLADLYALLGPESSGVGNWSAAEPLARALGSSTELPDERLNITAPGQESGTYDTFVELAIAPIADERDQPHETRPDYVAQSNDNAILQGLGGSRGSFGWVGYAFAAGAEDLRRIDVAAEADGTCVPAAPDTITDGSYPLARDLYIYVSRDQLTDAVVDYVDLYLSDEGTRAVRDVGYEPLDAEDLAESRERWASVLAER